MNKRRSRLEVICDILEAASEPIVPTRLMYQANLSWKPVRRYTEKLIAHGLLEEIDKGKVNPETGKDKRTKVAYVATAKGTTFMLDMKRNMRLLGLLDK